ncbi:nitrilase-related carbon-nitrogen hydrolase [Rhodococcus sp. IEGM 1366]|uniref:nitrilase-related carbon-nitrogen hydrolase n=1 Tax=Rhodococcus sp. IEGM 1366 TaxID=3082223 RepID=UPI002955302F|nr:nitrilase-related carbon-nitrogen hydrolase [Rhodococcus sp. IEGM 1366]MDV8070661.1 nitrilase-related carbon-nitrogen hydrolase [Rhodococcus sp. IEGM 1366]
MNTIHAAVKIACCQLPIEIGDRELNLKTIRNVVTEAAREGAKIVVLPELANTGYCFESSDELRNLAEPVNGKTIPEWLELSRDLDITLIGGFAELGRGDLIYNSAVLVESGKFRAVYRKSHLWDSEKKYFTAGDARPPVIETEHGRIGVMICYDIEFPEWVRIPSLKGADIICAPVNWPVFPVPLGERPIEIVKAQATCAANSVFLAVCDRAKSERGQEWIGGSVIIDRTGYPLTSSVQGTHSTIYATVDLTAARRKSISERNDVFGDRRIDLYDR